MTLLDAAKNLLAVWDHLGAGVHFGDTIEDMRAVIVARDAFKEMPPRSVFFTSMTISQVMRPIVEPNE